MGVRLSSSEIYLQEALEAAKGPRETLSRAIESIPTAVYLTDAEGHVTHYNQACISFAGRVPQPGADRWCVTWKLFTLDGEPLPHERCPMAVTVKEQRPVRGAEAWAERPDGSRIRFAPLPTPLYAEDGSFAGALNVMIDVTEARRVEELRNQAARCRRLASAALDRRTLDVLKAMAREYDEEAARLGASN